MRLTITALPGQQGQQQNQQQPQMPQAAPQEQPQEQAQGMGQQLANSPLANVARAGIGLASDIGADIAGTPGNIASLGLGFANWLTGGAIPTYQQVQEQLPVSLPTGQDIKGAISKATGGFTEPKSGLESGVRDVLGTAASLALPSRLLGKAGAGLSKILQPETAAKVGKGVEKVFLPFSGFEVSPKRALALASAGEVGAKGAETLGGGSVEQALTKMLFMGAANTAGTRKQLTEKMGENYKTANQAVSNKNLILNGKQTNAVPITNIKSQIDSLKSELKKSASPYKDQMNKVLSDFEQGFEASSKGHNFIRADDLMNLKKDLNQWIQLNEVPRFEGQAYLPKAARTEVERLLSSVKQGLGSIGEKNPEFAQSFAVAEDLAKGLYNSYNLGKFFKNNAGLDEILTSKLSKTAFGIYGAHHALMHPISTVAGIAGAIGGAELLKLKKLLRVPEARKAYEAAFKAAAKNDLRDFVVHATRFDKFANQIGD